MGLTGPPSVSSRWVILWCMKTMESVNIELVPLLEKLKQESASWLPETVLERVIQLGKNLEPQLDAYVDGKYRQDRNEITGFFDAVTKFAKTGLPISLDHLNSLIDDYKKRILPYPHYSGMTVQVSDNLL